MKRGVFLLYGVFVYIRMSFCSYNLIGIFSVIHNEAATG